MKSNAFGDYLRHLRKSRSPAITQEAPAKKIGRGKMTISQFEQNKKSRTNKRVVSVLLSLVIAVSCISPSFLIVSAVDTAQPVKILTNSLGNHVSIHSDLQEQYLNGPLQDIANYADGTEELSRPAKITLSWNTVIDEAYAAENGVSADGCTYTLCFGKSDDLSDAVTYSTSETSYEVTNLELDTTYYWMVSSEIGGERYESETASFTTERNGPRNLYVSGITNVRDIGGYTTLGGDTVKQGRIIRCGKLHNSDGSAKINEKGIAEMRDNLGVKSEIELRKVSNNEYGGVNGSVLGDDVNFFLLPMHYSGNMFEGTFDEDNIGSLRGVFEVLSKEENYPVIFHCAIGTDRTGMVAYCIEALLGMSETDIIRDYLFSNFGKINSSRSVSTIRSRYPKFIKNYDGRTLQEKTYKFLNEYVGVPAEQLDAVIRLNLIPRDDTVRGEPVSSQEEFLAMKDDGNYYLTDDISISSGYAPQFFGTLDGNGHTVTTATPIFDNLSGVVKNLKIQGSISTSDGKIGALAREGSRLTCINVKNYADVSITGKYYAGGLVGYSNVWASFIDCENHGDINSAYHSAGIVCRTKGELTFSNCKNDGAITSTPSSTSYYAGGMVAKSEGSVMMQNCQNSGTVTTSAKYVGGLGGYLGTEDVMRTVVSCENSGSVICGGQNAQELSYMGGIVGYMKGGRSYCTLSYCRNYGDIISNAGGKTILCGICGYVNSETIVIDHCTNNGSEFSPNASENICYHLYFNPTESEEKYIHNNDPWKYDNVSFTIEGVGTYQLPHEMTFGEWIMMSGSSTGNSAVWVSPVTGLTQKQIDDNPAFSGVWSAYRYDEQGKLYAEISSHRDSKGNVILPDNEVLSADRVPVTIFDQITPNSVYKLRDEIYLLGEANGDGQVTISDVTCIQKYLASMIDEEHIDLDAADINSNGVDITDATQIQRYIAGFTVPYPINEVCGDD